MIDIVSIVVSGVIGLVIIAVSFYLFAMYCHPEDKGVGTAIASKVIVVVAQTLAWGQLLLLPLDLSIGLSEPSNSSIQIVYDIIYVTIFVFTSFLIPFMTNLYQSDDEDPWSKRVGFSILWALAMCAIWSAVIFISYIWLSVYTGPNGQQLRVSVPLYIMLCFTFVGWILLSIFGAVGIVFLPYDLISGFVRRPRQLSSDEARRKKDYLDKKSSEMITLGEKLKEEEKAFLKHDGGWFSKRKLESSLKGSLENYKKEINNLEEIYETFAKEVPIKIKSLKGDEPKKSHTIVYCIMMFSGIIAGVVSLCWLIQLFGSTIYIDNKPMLSFLDPILYDISQGSLVFVSTIVYGVLVLYFLACAIQGNIRAGIRIPYVITFHAMKLNKTYMNSMLFNTNLMILCAAAVVNLAIICFPQYLAASYMYKFYLNEVFGKLPLFGLVYQDRIFLIVLLCTIGLSIVAMIIISVLACKKAEKEKESMNNKLL